MTQLCCLFSVRFLQPWSGKARCAGINAAPRSLTSEGNKSVIRVVTFCIVADGCSGVPRHVHHHLAAVSKDESVNIMLQPDGVLLGVFVAVVLQRMPIKVAHGHGQKSRDLD